MPDHSAPSNDLRWRAFAYISEEMPVDDRAAFEELLAVDQTAREAVAEAVAFNATVRAACTVEVASTNLATRKRFPGPVWSLISCGAIGVSLCLLLVLFSSFRDPSDKPVAPVASSELAITWSQLQGVSLDESLPWSDAADPSAEEALLEPSVDVASLADASLDADDLDTPSWMTAALQGAAAQKPKTMEN